MKRSLLVAALPILAFTGCGGNDSAPAPPPSANSAAAPAPKNIVEKTKQDVDSTTTAHKEAMDAAIEESSGNNSSGSEPSR